FLTPIPAAMPCSGFWGYREKLFCKFCQCTINWKHKGACEDHLQSKVNTKNKEKQFAAANTSQAITPLQTTAAIKNHQHTSEKDSRPQKKRVKLHLFLVMHCKQGGVLRESVSSLCEVHLPIITFTVISY
uniref:Uncharacterized protein n=1 Tax=Mola mola TaxID=94237 RepID=A0A3Q3X7E2_MOLML